MAFSFQLNMTNYLYLARYVMNSNSKIVNKRANELLHASSFHIALFVLIIEIYLQGRFTVSELDMAMFQVDTTLPVR